MNPEDILEKVYKLEGVAERIRAEGEGKAPVEALAQLRILLKGFFVQLTSDGAAADPRFLAKTLSLLGMLNGKYHFDQLLGTAPKYNVLIPYVQALVLRESDKTVEGLAAVERALEDHLGGMATPDFFHAPSRAIAGRPQLLGREAFRRLRLAALRVETALQHTALLSKLQRNAEALERATRAFAAAQMLARALGSVADLLVAAGPENVRLEGFELSLDWTSRYFAFVAELRLEGGDEPPWTAHGTSWSANSENVLKYLRQRLRARPALRRVGRDWVRAFSIWNVVRLEELEGFERRLDSAGFDDDFVLRAALVSVCSIFAIAAENRFIAMASVEGGPLPLHALTKDAQLQRDPRYIRSEQIHRRALEALLFGFEEDSKLAEHLLGSYKKNYLMNFYVIEEEEDSLDTTRNSEYFEEGPPPAPSPRPQKRAPAKPLSASVDKSLLSQLLKSMGAPRGTGRSARPTAKAPKEPAPIARPSKSMFSTRFADLISQMNSSVKSTSSLDIAEKASGKSLSTLPDQPHPNNFKKNK